MHGMKESSHVFICAAFNSGLFYTSVKAALAPCFPQRWQEGQSFRIKRRAVFGWRASLPVDSIAMPQAAFEGQWLLVWAWVLWSHQNHINGAARHPPSHVQELSGKALRPEGNRASSLGDPVVPCHRVVLGHMLDSSHRGSSCWQLVCPLFCHVQSPPWGAHSE